MTHDPRSSGDEPMHTTREEAHALTTLPLPALTDMIEQAPDAIILVDAAGAIVYANRRVTHLFGISPAELVGKSVEVLLPERLRTQHAVHRDHYGRDPRVRPMGDERLALVGRRADGSEFPVDIQLAPVSSDAQTWIFAVIRERRSGIT